MSPELQNLLFLDIETVAIEYEYDRLDERLQAQWARKASFLRRDSSATDEQIYHDRAGIYAEFGKVICIAVGRFMENDEGVLTLRTKAFYGDDEKDVLSSFRQMLEKFDQSQLRLCAHNGKEFDFPYLCRRMLVNCIALPATLNMHGKKPWEVQHLDTMEMWKFGDYKHYTSLDLLAAIFNIPTSKSDIDGSQVNSIYYRENGLIRIKDYCLRDVVVLAQLFLKMKCIYPEKELIVNTAP